MKELSGDGDVLRLSISARTVRHGAPLIFTGDHGMLLSMRRLALSFVAKKLAQKKNEELPSNLEEWFRTTRQNNGAEILPYLVENNQQIGRIYVITPDLENLELAHLEVRDNKPEEGLRYPFTKPSGSQSPAIGPVIKRSPPSKGKSAGPAEKIIRTTVKKFVEHSQSNKPWSNYFSDVLQTISRERIVFDGEEYSWEEGNSLPTNDEKKEPNNLQDRAVWLLNKVIKIIPERETVLVVVETKEHHLPGDIKEFKNYLIQELPNAKYTTKEAPPKESHRCSLCQDMTTTYPNGVKGAYINIANQDRAGAFAAMKANHSWKGFSICGICADLLYIYKVHVSPHFQTRIAGEKALAIPTTNLSADAREDWLKNFDEWVKGVKSGTNAIEDDLLEILAEESGIAEVTILWAEFGQLIENVKGTLSEILPSRLKTLSLFNLELNKLQHPIFPQHHISEFNFSLNLSSLRPLFQRPGGKKTKSLNESKRLFSLRRELAAAIYHQEELNKSRLWDEFLLTARCRMNQAATTKEPTYSLLNEGVKKTKTGSESFLTFSGWIRQFARFLHYLRKEGVLKMPKDFYTPKLESIQPYFGMESGIDTKEKAFAFLLGILYGRVLRIQGARGVNVGANALTWLKRLTLKGKDLPEFYIKVREKLLSYEAEKDPKLRELIQEIGKVAVQLGDHIQLDTTQTCYFLLLGQSLSGDVFPKKEQQTGQ